MSILHTVRTFLIAGRGVLRGLPTLEAAPEPIGFFQRWLDDATRTGTHLPEAMTVATVSSDGRPSARMMLLKKVSPAGFEFYTNYESRKAAELDGSGHAALVFHWARLERQVRVEGAVERLAREESEAYFRTRDRGSQIGAWASKQSAALDRRDTLDARVEECRNRFADRDIPLPPFWGGYRLVPGRIEFWQGRINRLHDRLCYTKEGDEWEVIRLYP